MNGVSAPVPVPYAPRRRSLLAPWRIGTLDLRVHWIDVQGEAPPAPLVAVARGHAEARLPECVAREGGAHGLGFVVIHRGTEGVWLLMDWWAHGDILCQRLSRAGPDGAAFAALDDRPLAACVLEIEVVAEERQRWIDAMMTDRPDPAAYLGSGA